MASSDFDRTSSPRLVRWTGSRRRGRHRPRPGCRARTTEAVAAEIARATPERDEGDGNTPPDPDEGLCRFVEVVTAPGTRERDGGWLGGIREYIPDAGPVPSSRFL
jgi:hypothetical protein